MCLNIVHNSWLVRKMNSLMFFFRGFPWSMGKEVQLERQSLNWGCQGSHWISCDSATEGRRISQRNFAIRLNSHLYYLKFLEEHKVSFGLTGRNIGFKTGLHARTDVMNRFMPCSTQTWTRFMKKEIRGLTGTTNAMLYMGPSVHTRA